MTENGLPAVLVHESRKVYGLQFHPEVSHCEHGERILENFAVRICGARRQWSVEAYLREITPALRAQVGARTVLLLASGGVDSTVVAALLLAVLPPEQVHLLYVDTGLMRKGESLEVGEALRRLGARHLHQVDASREFFQALRGVDDPEEKRRRIGDLFIRVQEASIAEAGVSNDFLAQGTLYTDLIESGKGVGRQGGADQVPPQRPLPAGGAQARTGAAAGALERPVQGRGAPPGQAPGGARGHGGPAPLPGARPGGPHPGGGHS